LLAKQVNESFQRHRFAFPYLRADAISNVIDVFEVESAFVGALDRVLNVLSRGRQSAAYSCDKARQVLNPFRREFVDASSESRGTTHNQNRAWSLLASPTKQQQIGAGCSRAYVQRPLRVQQRPNEAIPG
jgi:hypothetical protein